MKLQRKKRLILIVFIIGGISIAVGLALYALNKNIDLYYTPSQLISTPLNSQQSVRLGGMVKKQSVQFAQQGLQVDFILTDYSHDILVIYNGVLPTLFREGQGVVVQGKLNAKGILIADQVLAKHDATYMPPGIKYDS